VWGRGAVTRVGRAPAEGGGGRGREAREAGGGVEEGLVVKEERTLVDEALDDCLVGARGSQGIHRREVWPHEGGPEADGQVFTGHQVQPVHLAHPGKRKHKHTHTHTINCGAGKKNWWVSPTEEQLIHRMIETVDRELTCVSGSLQI